MSGVTDFIALDVETANADFASICSIGLVHFKKGEVFKSLTILVDPEDDFDPVNVAIHGVRPEDVAGKPTMARVFPVIAGALQETVIVHHSPFDRTALARAAVKYNADGLPCTWLDSLQVARRSWEDCRERGGYGLSNLARLFEIQFKHHDACEDARCAGLIVDRAIRDTGIPLNTWVEQWGYRTTPGDAVARPIRKPSYAGSKFATIGAADGPMQGEVVVFTGSLSIPRGEAAKMAAAVGCDVADTVTKKTTILVVGDQDLRATRGQEKSSKHRKCEAMNASGARIRIVGESDFRLLVS
jgi:DNA polymerase-3 subunit epsilon